MSTLSATFGRPLEDAALEGYWIGLTSIDDGQFLCAMRTALETCKYMPPPSELLGFVRKRRRDAEQLEMVQHPARLTPGASRDVVRLVDPADVMPSEQPAPAVGLPKIWAGRQRPNGPKPK